MKTELTMTARAWGYWSGATILLSGRRTVPHLEGVYEARMNSLRLRPMVSTSFLRVVEDICKPCAGLLRPQGESKGSCKTRHEVDANASTGVRWTGECEKCQPSGDVVGGIVKRIGCEVFMGCNLVELCVKERRVRRISIPESQRGGPRDGTRARGR